jgi:hypothetical protein
MLPRLPLFAVHSGRWPVARFGPRAFREFLVCRIAEDAARCTVAASVPNKFQIFQKFRNFFSNTPRDLYGGEAAPAETRPPSLEVSQKSMLFPGHERRESRRWCHTFTALVVRYSGDVVDLQSAADSARRSAAARARANSRDAPVAGPALSRRHGPTARSQMGGDPEPRNDRSLGWAFPIRGCSNQLLGFGRL